METDGATVEDKGDGDNAVASFIVTDIDKNSDDRNLIKCIFLCKFHATAGPQIAAQVPDNYISKDVFDTISRYVIPKLQLERCFLSLYVFIISHYFPFKSISCCVWSKSWNDRLRATHIVQCALCYLVRPIGNGERIDGTTNYLFRFDFIVLFA